MSENAEDSQAPELRFEFGKNWKRFLELVDDKRIQLAKRSLQDMLECETLEGRRFLDVGSGSGLFSLAARSLGATVHSFDYDPESVACARVLRARYRPGDEAWTIERGDVLDDEYLHRLGTFNVVYSWGVLHHTGDMWRALGNVVKLVEPGGQLFVALYNDQGGASKRWARIKKMYVHGSKFRRFLIVFGVLIFFETRGLLISISRFENPFSQSMIKRRENDRGMSKYRDLVDWVGGFPFQVSKPDEVFEFVHKRGFWLTGLKTRGGRHGCNEYVFRFPPAGR